MNEHGPGLAEALANTAAIYSVDEVHPDAPRRSWIHDWRHAGAESPLLRVLRDGCGEVRLRWPSLR